jgi:Zn-dependent peptidase ImmA (M78 family)
VNVRAIAVGLGAQVEEVSLDYSGSFNWIDGKPVIRVNANEPLVRRRFTLAHEIGHFQLRHEDSFRDHPESFSTGNYDPREIAANQFAAELLMPEIAVRYLVFKLNLKAIGSLAAKLQVSEVAMQYRLKNLGLIS